MLNTSAVSTTNRTVFLFLLNGLYAVSSAGLYHVRAIWLLQLNIIRSVKWLLCVRRKHFHPLILIVDSWQASTFLPWQHALTDTKLLHFRFEHSALHPCWRHRFALLVACTYVSWLSWHILSYFIRRRGLLLLFNTLVDQSSYIRDTGVRRMWTINNWWWADRLLFRLVVGRWLIDRLINHDGLIGWLLIDWYHTVES